MHLFQRAIKNNIKKFKIRSIYNDKVRKDINDMPQPKSLPIVGTRLDILAAGGGTRLHKFIDSRHKQLGPIFAERLAGSEEIVFISDPMLMKELFISLEGKYPLHILPDPWVLYEKLYGPKRGLFFMNGEEWLTNRRVLNKHLLREGTEDWITVPIMESTENFINDLKDKVKKNNHIKNLESELYKLSIDVVINVLLGPNSLRRSQHYYELLFLLSSSVKKIFQTTTKLYGWPVEWCQRLNLKSWRDFKESVDLSLQLANKMVFEMIRNTDKSSGLIQRLLQEDLSHAVIAKIAADFIIAASDTTAYTTIWLFLLLSKNTEVIKEIRTRDRTYVKFVVKEAMRLYPVAPFLTRILPKETILGNYTLNKGTPIVASIYTSGRNEQNFSEPHLFLPYRWDRKDPQKVSLSNHVPSASLPFAMGTRSCIGKKIALIQLIEVISQVVNNFDIDCTNSKDVDSVTSQVLIPDRQLEFVITLKDEQMIDRRTNTYL